MGGAMRYDESAQYGGWGDDSPNALERKSARWGIPYDVYESRSPQVQQYQAYRLGGGTDPWSMWTKTQNPGQPPVVPPGTGTGTTPQPPVPDALSGLMQQASDPWSVYGQMGVNEPYLSNINNRFGWSSQGLAYPTQLQATSNWYNPPIVYPNVVQPPLVPKTS